MRIPVSAPQNIWFDSEDVDDSDLTLEQDFNNQIQTGIINNHFGSGILPDTLNQVILFDSNLATGLLDGKPISAQAQPADNQYGNQLSVALTGSMAAGTRTVKVLIIGLNFEQNLQYDALTFHTNETQITSQHYVSVLTILFNDFIGSASQSFNLGGRIVISDTAPVTLSRDCVMVAQNYQPNLFFRDFFVSSGGTIGNVLTAALPDYNINTLNIATGYLQLASIVENDVSTQIGQKFLTTTNNIQKITLLMSVGASAGTPNNFVWTGDILVSVYPLQSTVNCSTDITPQLAIEYDPSGVPIAQLSFNYSSLLNAGIQLSTVPQPVDFVFSNTPLGAGTAIISGNYYTVTVKRAGSANNCQIQLAVGANSSTTMWQTVFNGSTWTDIPSQSLWFEVWTDAAKVSDGQGYDVGHGIVIPKTNENPLTGATQDYVLNQLPFNGNETFYALLQAVSQQSTPVQDERTGNPVNSEQQFVPSVSLLNINALNNIQGVSDPLVVGTIWDQNVKVYSAYNSTLSAAFHEYGMVNNEIVIKVVTNTTDGYRYDQNIIELVAAIVEGNLNGAMFTPNAANPNLFYKVAKAELITMLYGDVDGNGIINQNDLLLAQQLLNSNLNVFPSYQQYIVQTTYFVQDSNLAWTIYQGNTPIASGVHGIITPNPNNAAQANFEDATANFNSIVGLGGDTIVISGSVASAGNNGTFAIVNLIDNIDITIQKTFYTSETILQIMRGDVDGDMILNYEDYTYISNYIEAVPPFPPTSSPANLVGTPFEVIRITLEEYIDRQDDYPSTISNRATTLHPLPDIFLDGYTAFANLDVETVKNPNSSNGYGLSFVVAEQLLWEDYSVLTNPNPPRQVACSFTSQTGAPIAPNLDPGAATSVAYPIAPPFDAGKNDFYVPDNLIINNGGQILRPDGYFMKLDFEINTIIIEVPPVTFNMEHSVNLLENFVADFYGTGYTLLGYPAMRFADTTTVSLNALQLNQVKFAVAVQSFSPLVNGIDPNCLDGIVVEGQIGVSIDYFTGILTLNFANLYQDPVLQTLNTKVEITVYLKKAGWNNPPLFINSTVAQNILSVPTPPVDGYSCQVAPVMTAYITPGSPTTITVILSTMNVSLPVTGVVVLQNNGLTVGTQELVYVGNNTSETVFTVTLESVNNFVAYYAGDPNYAPTSYGILT